MVFNNLAFFTPLGFFLDKIWLFFSQKMCGNGDGSVTVNPQLETHLHPLPLPEELMRRLGGGYGFTKLTWQMPTTRSG